MKEIEKKALAMKGREPKREKEFMWLDEAAPTISLPMERPLRMPPAQMELAADALTVGEHEGSLEAIFNQVYVDKALLRTRIEDMLETRPKVTLKEVITAYPIEKGLFELLAYMEITKSEACHFTSAKERIFFRGIDGRSRYVTMERIVFEKKEP